MPHMIFTGLEDYKARGTQAAPYFTVTYYTDFSESKDLVLIRGDVVFTSKLNDEEAKWLVETAQSFYLNDARYKLVERFNKETRNLSSRMSYEHWICLSYDLQGHKLGKWNLKDTVKNVDGFLRFSMVM